MRVHRTSVGNIEIAEVEIPDMMSVAAAGDDFGMHRFVDGVKSVNRRTEIMVTRLLVHELFGDDAVLCHEPSGAPYVEKSGKRIEMGFSLSHCRGWVVAAWSASESVGVDVEIVDKRVDRVKERVFSSEEQRFIGTSTWKATVAWTAKEAVFKCAGEEGVDLRGDICLDLRSLVDGAKSSRYHAEAFGVSYDVHSFSTGNRILSVTSNKR